MADLQVEDAAVDPGEIPPSTDTPRQPKGKGKISSLLGDNKKARGGPRRLVKADTERLAMIYTVVGMALAPRNLKLGQAFAENAENCAEAWANWAEQNDMVRRTILWLIEGGAAGAVFFAHLPILVAGIPEDKLPPVLAMFASQQSANGQGEMPDTEGMGPIFVERPS